jgi:hypothetical protein
MEGVEIDRWYAYEGVDMENGGNVGECQSEEWEEKGGGGIYNIVTEAVGVGLRAWKA